MSVKRIRVELTDPKFGVSDDRTYYPPGSVLELDEPGANALISIGRAAKTDKPLSKAPDKDSAVERGISPAPEKAERAVLKR